MPPHPQCTCTASSWRARAGRRARTSWRAPSSWATRPAPATSLTRASSSCCPSCPCSTLRPCPCSPRGSRRAVRRRRWARAASVLPPRVSRTASPPSAAAACSGLPAPGPLHIRLPRLHDDLPRAHVHVPRHAQECVRGGGGAGGPATAQLTGIPSLRLGAALEPVHKWTLAGVALMMQEDD